MCLLSHINVKALVRTKIKYWLIHNTGSYSVSVTECIFMGFSHQTGIRAHELCERWGGHPGLPVPNSLYGLCGPKARMKKKEKKWTGKQPVERFWVWAFVALGWISFELLFLYNIYIYYILFSFVSNWKWCVHLYFVECFWTTWAWNGCWTVDENGK